MSQKRKQQRARREEQEKKQAQKVIFWIFGVLILLGIICMISFFTM